VDRILTPQRVTRGVHGGDAKARINYLETSQVAGEEEIFEVASFYVQDPTADFNGIYKHNFATKH
jgi:hypothetical protein